VREWSCVAKAGGVPKHGRAVSRSAQLGVLARSLTRLSGLEPLNSRLEKTPFKSEFSTKIQAVFFFCVGESAVPRFHRQWSSPHMLGTQRPFGFSSPNRSTQFEYQRGKLSHLSWPSPRRRPRTPRGPCAGTGHTSPRKNPPTAPYAARRRCARPRRSRAATPRRRAAP
jgi:hypothetical protein